MKQLTVLYDGACPLCRREIGLMRRLDWLRTLSFTDISESGAPENCPIDRAVLLERFHVQTAGGAMKSGAAAFAAIWRRIPLLAPFGFLALFPPVLWLLERGYRVFLRVRPRLQRMFVE